MKSTTAALPAITITYGLSAKRNIRIIPQNAAERAEKTKRRTMSE